MAVDIARAGTALVCIPLTTMTAAAAVETAPATPIRFACQALILTGWTRITTVGVVSSARSLLYLLARLMGDVNAIQRGTVGKRLARRIAGRQAGSLLGKLFR